MRLTFMAGTAAAVLFAGVELLPGVAHAQPGGVSSACSIDPNTPKELALQTLAMSRVGLAQSPEEANKILQGVLKELDTKPKRFEKNSTGYNYVLSQVLSAYIAGMNTGPTPTRGSLGFVTNPDQPYDLVENLDATFKAIVASAPECASDVETMRQNEAWLALTKAALDASNVAQLDSAEYYARRAMVLSTANPYPEYVLANVANARDDKKGAIAHWQKVVELAGSDTTYSDLHDGSLYYIAMTQYELASSLSGAQQVAEAKDAAGSLKALFLANMDSPDAVSMLQAWSESLRMAGDTANIQQVYADLLQNPERASDLTFTMAGVIATQINRGEDALKLFELAAQKNPYNRDAQRNIAVTYHGRDMFQEMIEPTRKLVELDPNNYDAWMMFAYSAQGLGKEATDAKVRQAWTDSLIKYQNFADSLPVKVEVMNFTRGSKTASVSLSLEQMASSVGNYSVTAEFLDAAGNVVASGTESSGAIPTGERKTVTINVSGEKIVGFRYKPLK